MTTKMNNTQGTSDWWAVIDTEDGYVAVLEGRPALYEEHEMARRAMHRTSRPARHQVQQVRIISAEPGRTTKPSPTPPPPSNQL